MVQIKFRKISTTNQISDPSRLLPELSVVSLFYREDHRRKRFENSIFCLESEILSVLRDFKCNKLVPPSFDGTCSHRWEQTNFINIQENFFKLEENIKDLLLKFVSYSSEYAWDLWECHGFTDDQYARYRRRIQDVKYRSQLRTAFSTDLYSLCLERSISVDDLPF